MASSGRLTDELFEKALGNSLKDFPHIPHLKEEQKHCLRSMAEKRKFSEFSYRIWQKFDISNVPAIYQRREWRSWLQVMPLQPKTVIYLQWRDLCFKRGQRKCSCIRRQITPTRHNNCRKSIWMSQSLSMKQAAKITFAQSKCRFLQKKFIETGSILAQGKSHVLPTNPLFTLRHEIDYIPMYPRNR